MINFQNIFPLRIFGAPKLVGVESLYDLTIPESLLIVRVKLQGWGAVQANIVGLGSRWRQGLKFFWGSKDYEVTIPVDSILIFHAGNLFGMRTYRYIAKPNISPYPEINPSFTDHLPALNSAIKVIEQELHALPSQNFVLDSKLISVNLEKSKLTPKEIISQKDIVPIIQSNAITPVVKRIEVPVLDTQKIGQELDEEIEIAKMPRAVYS